MCTVHCCFGVQDADDVIACCIASPPFVSWKELRIPPAQRMGVRDVANNKDLPGAVGSFEATAAKHGVAFVTLTPASDETG